LTNAWWKETTKVCDWKLVVCQFSCIVIGLKIICCVTKIKDYQIQEQRNTEWGTIGNYVWRYS
jgi:hypothetical protein